MNKVQKLLDERNIPDVLKGVKTKSDFLKKQDKIRKLLAERQYGEIPARPEHMYAKSGEPYERFAAGKATRTNHTLGFEMDGKSFSFPMISVIPNGKKKCPAFVFISFEGGEASKYMPTEEIVERGFALFTFNYKDVSSDDNNFKDGIAKYLVKSRRKNTATSKITLWAWAAMRVMDYIETLGDVIDLENVAVIGHSRLGKTALVAGGYDTRFKYVISNDSGCCGAAIESGKVVKDTSASARSSPTGSALRSTAMPRQAIPSPSTRISFSHSVYRGALSSVAPRRIFGRILPPSFSAQPHLRERISSSA